MIFEKIYDMENLQAAWNRVRANRPGPGIDRVRWEDFEANLLHNLHLLQKQIREEAYKPLPVSVFNEPKPTGKPRVIGISSMRDKVVQQAVLLAISSHFEKYFLPCCYAYRPGVSALSAVKRAGQCIARGKLWLLKMDVEKFFDTMDHVILLELIRKVIDEKPILRLLSRLLKAKIFKEMGLFDNLVGSQQGSGLSPLLSNIFLYPLDKELWGRYKECYLRYSDDIAVFADEKEKLEETRELIEQLLTRLKLVPNQSKTSISHISAGVVYLGFYMDAKGKGPAKKSIDSLEAKLSEYDKVRKTDNAFEKLGEAMAAIRGWYNYYKVIKPIKAGNILSLIALVQIAKEFGEMNHARELIKESRNFAYNHPDICFQVGELYADFGMRNQAIREYARALELDPAMEAAKEKVRKLQEGEENIHLAIERIQLLLHHNPHYREGYQRLADLYMQLGLYGFAEKAHGKAIEIDDEAEAELEDKKSSDNRFAPPTDDGFDYRSVGLDTFTAVFAGRRDAHAKQWVDERGRWGFARVDRPMKTRDAHAHLKGDVTLAVYPVTAMDTVNFIVFDVDTAKRIILGSGSGLIEDFRNKAHQDILRIKSTCDQLGLSMYIEDSGYKGRHGWVFFEEELPATLAIQVGREIIRRSGAASEGMIWELFPMGKSERHQSLIKLPLGINRKNNRRCLYLNLDNHAIADQALFLKTIKRNKPGDLRLILDNLSGGGMEGEGLLPGDQGHATASPGINKMVKSCKVLNHLITKARETNYLNHYERSCLLYTLSFAGEEGCRLLHRAISFCINYDYQYTQKQIERRKESPISCARIMENFPELSETLHCDCKFKLPPRSYPSPVLYLLESEIEGAGAKSPCSKPGKESLKNERQEELLREETINQPVPTFDFEQIFSEEFQSRADEEQAGVEHGEPASTEVLVPTANLSERDALGEGYHEWSDEMRVPVPDRDEEQQEHSALKGPPVPEDPFSNLIPTYGQVEEEGERETVGAPEETNLPRGTVEADAWELVLQYLNLRHSEERMKNELQAVRAKLDALFSALGADTLKTSRGTISRVRGNGGSSCWTLMTAD